MERQSIYTIRVNTNNADKEIGGVAKSVDNLSKSTKAAAAENKSFEDRLKEVNETVKQGEFSMRGANKLIQEYQTIAMQAGRESPVGREAIEAAAQLQDRVSDLRTEVMNLSKDGQAMQGALAIGQTTLAGYSAFKGVTAMLGVENEKLMETMVKLQAAQATLNSLEQIRAETEKQSVLMLTLKTVGTKAAAAATAIYATVTGTATGALKLFRIALMATGIGAIVVGIGMLIANFEKVTEWVQKARDRFNNMGDTMKNVLSVVFPFIGAIRLVIAGLERLGIVENESSKQSRLAAEARTKAIAKETEQRRKQIDNQINLNRKLQDSTNEKFDFEIAKAQAAGKDTFELEKQKRAEYRKTLEIELELLEKSLKANATNLSVMMSKLKEIEQTRKEIVKTEQQDELATIRRRTEISKKAAENAENETQKKEEERAKQLEIQRKYEDLLIANIQDESKRRRMELGMRHLDEMQDAIEAHGKQSAFVKQLEIKQANEMNALKDTLDKDAKAAQNKRDKEERDERLLAAENDLKETLAADELTRQEKLKAEIDFEMERFKLLQEQYADNAEMLRKIELENKANLKKINDDYKADEQATADAIKAARQSVLDQSIKIVGQLGQLGKEGGSFAKAMALTEIAANTAIGFANGLTIAQTGAKSKGPLAPYAFPAFYAQQVGAVLAAANQARKILGTGPNIPDDGGGGVTPPSIPQAQTAREFQQGELVGDQQQESTTRVAVLESDITRTQNRIQDIEVRTTF